MSSTIRRSPRLAAKVVKAGVGKIKVSRGTMKHYMKSIGGLNSSVVDRQEVIQEMLDDIVEHTSDNHVYIAYALLLAAQEYAKQMEEDHIEGLISLKALQAKMYNHAVKAFKILESRFLE
jgi:hypothetical protein